MASEPRTPICCPEGEAVAPPVHPTPRGRPQAPHPMLQTRRHRCFRKGVWGGLWCDPEAHSPVGRGPTQVGLGQGDSGTQKEEHCLPACLSCAPPRPEVTEYHLGSETEARLGTGQGQEAPPSPLLLCIWSGSHLRSWGPELQTARPPGQGAATAPHSPPALGLTWPHSSGLASG